MSGAGKKGKMGRIGNHTAASNLSSKGDVNPFDTGEETGGSTDTRVTKIASAISTGQYPNLMSEAPGQRVFAAIPPNGEEGDEDEESTGSDSLHSPSSKESDKSTQTDPSDIVSSPSNPATVRKPSSSLLATLKKIVWIALPILIIGAALYFTSAETKRALFYEKPIEVAAYFKGFFNL